MGIAPKRLERAKDRIRGITRWNRGIDLERMIRELKSFLSGRGTYFRHAAMKSHLVELDGWLRLKLRRMRLKQCKRVKPMVDFFVLRSTGRVATSGVVYGVVGFPDEPEPVAGPSGSDHARGALS